MIISVPTNNQAYLTTQNTVTADVNKPSTAVNNIDERVNAIVDDNEQTSLRIAGRLADRSNLPAYQQKEAQNTLAHMQNTKSVVFEMESVASQLNEVIDQDDVEGNENIAQLRAQLKDLNKQLKAAQSTDAFGSKAQTVGEEKEVQVKFNSSEISLIVDTLSKIELTGDSRSVTKQHLSGEAGLMSQLDKIRSELDTQLQDAYATHLTADSQSVQQASTTSKNTMLEPSGAKQLTGTQTTADVAVSILS